MAGPNMQMSRIKGKDCVSIAVSAGRHFQLDIFILQVFLLEIHSNTLQRNN
jgi:hypothetical protein